MKYKKKNKSAQKNIASLQANNRNEEKLNKNEKKKSKKSKKCATVCETSSFIELLQRSTFLSRFLSVFKRLERARHFAHALLLLYYEYALLAWLAVALSRHVACMYFNFQRLLCIQQQQQKTKTTKLWLSFVLRKPARCLLLSRDELSKKLSQDQKQ